MAKNIIADNPIGDFVIFSDSFSVVEGFGDTQFSDVTSENL
jgi:hypothetical protein